MCCYFEMLLNLYRLGGIPLGVICVETRMVEQTIPADPANLDSEVKVLISLRFLVNSVFLLDYQLNNLRVRMVYFVTR